VFETVVVGSTDSGGADKAFRRALELTRAAGGTLHIVCALGDEHDGPPPDMPDEFRYTCAGAGRTEWHMYQLRCRAESKQVRVETHAMLARPADAIAKVVAEEGADLVVVGTGSGHGTRQLSGVPKAVMDRVACAVLVV
jgi:nucleotide-binding universal stress UspA family protein